jgi:hypothetical protein
MKPKEDVGPLGMCNCYLYLSEGIPSTPNQDCMQTVCPKEVDISSNHIEPHKPFGVSSFGVMVFDV